MHAGKEVHCWVKLCYCWLDEDKGQLIKIIEKQYNSLLRYLPGKTLLSCQFTDQDTQTEGDRLNVDLLQMPNIFNRLRKENTYSDHKNPHKKDKDRKRVTYFYN